MIGSIIEVMTASVLRRLRRRLRPVMTVARVSAPGASDMGRCLRRRGGEREEDVVEGRGVEREAVDVGAVRVDLVGQGAYVGGGAVRGDAQGAGLGGVVDGAGGQSEVGLAGAEHEVEPVPGDA